MTEEDRERTMNFILEQQAQSAARMEKFETGMEKLERALIFMAHTFRRERKDLRERISALVDAQVRSEDKIANSDERLSRIEEMLERSIASSRENFREAEKRMQRIEEMMERNAANSGARLARIEELTGRNSEDIRSLSRFVSRGGVKQEGGADEG